MGNVLEYPDKPRPGIGASASPSGHQHSFLAQRQVILPFNATQALPETMKDTEPKYPGESEGLVVETSMFDTSNPTITSGQESPADLASLPYFTDGRASGPTSAYSGHSSATSGTRRRRYIKRYQNEEERLLDMVHEKERQLKAAIYQGQQLRAKCNRYKDELETFQRGETTDLKENQWRRKHAELDKKYRDLREETDVLEARIKNGRDLLVQSNETIQVLTDELNQQRLSGHVNLSTSMPNLATISVKDPKGRRTITQLMVDNTLLQEQVRQLTNRNRNGREYLRTLEHEKRDQQATIMNLQTQLKHLQADNNRHRDGDGGGEPVSGDGGVPLYADVNKRKTPNSLGEGEYIIEEILEDDDEYSYPQTRPAPSPGAADRRSMGFEIDIDSPRYSEGGLPSPLRSSTNMYEEIVVSNGQLTESGTSIRGRLFSSVTEGRHASHESSGSHGDEYNDAVFINNHGDITTRF